MGVRHWNTDGLYWGRSGPSSGSGSVEPQRFWWAIEMLSKMRMRKHDLTHFMISPCKILIEAAAKVAFSFSNPLRLVLLFPNSMRLFASLNQREDGVEGRICARVYGPNEATEADDKWQLCLEMRLYECICECTDQPRHWYGWSSGITAQNEAWRWR